MDDQIYTVLTTFFAAISCIAAAISGGVAYRVFIKHGLPDIIVYSCAHAKMATFMMIRIENIGRGVATNIQFKPSRPIPHSTNSAKDMSNGPLINGIPSLVSGEVRDVMWSEYRILEKAIGDEPITINFTYNHGKKKLKGSSQIEVKSFVNSPTSGEPIAVIADNVAHINRSIQKMTRKDILNMQPPQPRKE